MINDVFEVNISKLYFSRYGSKIKMIIGNKISIKQKIIISFFIFIIINYVFFNYRILFRQNGYILGDWVINYSAGFVKRAFIGHLFYLISKSFNISIISLVFLFSSSVYLITIFFFYKIIKEKLTNHLIFLFIFLPSAFLFNFFDPLTVGRKEILVLFFFTFYYLYLNKINKDIKFKIITYFIFIIISLTHEIIIFFIPYLFLLKYFNFNNDLKNKIKSYWLEILILFSGIIILIIIFKFNHLHNNDLLCRSLQDVGLTNQTCWAINDFKNQISINFINHYFLEKNYYFNYSIYFALSIIPLILIITKTNKNINKSKFIFSSIICLIISISFFIQVNDWGRYLNIIFLIQFLTVLKFINNDKQEFQNNLNLFSILKYIFIFFYLSTWHMPHCCNPEVGQGYYDVFKRIKSRIYDNSYESTKYKDLPRFYLRKILKID